MKNLFTLRNIITLFAFLFLASCNKDGLNSNSIELKSISSEDKYSAVTKVGEIKDSETGQTIYLVRKNK